MPNPDFQSVRSQHGSGGGGGDMGRIDGQSLNFAPNAGCCLSTPHQWLGYQVVVQRAHEDLSTSWHSIACWLVSNMFA
jgi:hypothetical protein